MSGAYLGLKLDLRAVARLLVLRRARVAELEEHLAPEDAARVHVRHRDHVLCRHKAPTAAQSYMT